MGRRAHQNDKTVYHSEAATFHQRHHRGCRFFNELERDSGSPLRLYSELRTSVCRRSPALAPARRIGNQQDGSSTFDSPPSVTQGVTLCEGFPTTCEQYSSKALLKEVLAPGALTAFVLAGSAALPRRCYSICQASEWSQTAAHHRPRH